MNRKAEYIDSIVSIVYESCCMEIGDTGVTTFSRDDILGPSREENVVMTRCILVMQILREGYSVSTVAKLLNRTPHAIRNLQKKGNDYLYTSRAFALANAEATIKVENLRKSIGL